MTLITVSVSIECGDTFCFWAETLPEELDQMFPAQLPAQQHAVALIPWVNLKRVLCQVDANSRNLHLVDAPLSSVVADTSTLAQRCRHE